MPGSSFLYTDLPYLVHNRLLDLDAAKECSHICHNTLCIEPSHLVFELHEINMNRNFVMRFVNYVMI
jgi:hypothetical protein